MARLDGRLGRLERHHGPARAEDRCASCGLLHVGRFPIEEAEAIVRAGLGGSRGSVPIRPRCLCGCCGERRSVAELTHLLGSGGR